MLTEEDVKTILGHMILFRRYERTVILYLETLKITLNEPYFFTADQPFFQCAKKDHVFLNEHFKNEHNQRRMTRVLRSLKCLYPVFAMQLLATLQHLIEEKGIVVSSRVLNFWTKEVSYKSLLNF